jgi:hypothetical protein
MRCSCIRSFIKASSDEPVEVLLVVAWQPPGERPVLFTSPNSAFAPGRAIRGGIPIIFPWFGANRHAPAAPQHGFARTATWHLDGVETTGNQSLTLTLGLGDGDVGSPFWPEPFRAIYTVTFAQTLSLRLAVQNRATHPITFEAALHAYFAHHGGDRQRLPRYAGAMRHRRSRVAPPRRHRKGRRRLEHGVESLGRKGECHGRSRRPRVARHGLRRDREYRRRRGAARHRWRAPDVDGDFRRCRAMTFSKTTRWSRQRLF